MVVIDFIVTNTIGNAIAITIGAVILWGFARGFLPSKSFGKRAAITGLGGLLGGLWSYSAYQIPHRPLEFVEALTLSIGMFSVPALMAYGMMRLRGKSKSGPAE